MLSKRSRRPNPKPSVKVISIPRSEWPDGRHIVSDRRAPIRIPAKPAIGEKPTELRHVVHVGSLDPMPPSPVHVLDANAAGHGIVEEALDLAREARLLIGLHGEQIVRAGIHDRCGDLRIAGNGVNGDQRTVEAIRCRKSLKQQRIVSCSLTSLGDRLLAKTRRSRLAKAGTRCSAARPLRRS